MIIREMKRGEENNIRTLLAKLSYEDQTFWRREIRSLEELLTECSRIPISDEINGRNVILVAEGDGIVVGFCWCTIVDRGVDKQAEVVELYVEKEFRSKGVGKELLRAMKQLFISEQVEVAFAWTHQGNKAAIKLYKDAGFKEVDQLVMAFIPPKKSKANVL